MFACNFTQRVVVGLYDAGFIFLQAFLDIGDSMHHDLPEQGGEFASERLIGNESTTACTKTSIKSAQRLIGAARQTLRQHTEDPSGAIAWRDVYPRRLPLCREPGAKPVQAVKCLALGQRLPINCSSE